jgi:hypothetical protein
MQASQVEERGVRSGREQLGRLEMIFAILIAQLELGEAQFLQELLVPVQGLLLLQVVRAVIVGALVDRTVGALFPAVEGALTVRAPVNGFRVPMAASDLRQLATDFAAQLAGLTTIVEVEIVARGVAIGAAAGDRERAGVATSNRSQRSAAGFQVLGTELLPVQGRLKSRRLSEGSFRVDKEIAVVRVLLAKIIAGWDLGLGIGQQFSELANQLFQFRAAKFSAQPKDKACYFVHGGWSPRNWASSLNVYSRTETQPLFTFPVKSSPTLSLRTELWKLTRCGNRGKIKEPKRFSHCSHSAWKTLRKKRCEFPTVPTASAASSSIETKQHNETAPKGGRQRRFAFLTDNSRG